MSSPLYVGFSSIGVTSTNTRFHDIEIIKRDLRNAFNTRKGSRLMRPDEGFIGHDLIYDFNEPNVQGRIEADTKRIVNKDPRIELRDLDVVFNDMRDEITLTCLLYAIEFDMDFNFTEVFRGEQ